MPKHNRMLADQRSGVNLGDYQAGTTLLERDDSCSVSSSSMSTWQVEKPYDSIESLATLLRTATLRPADAELALDESLDRWQSAWVHSGKLQTIMAATLGHSYGAEMWLGKKGKSPATSWPKWGLRAHIDAERHQLNIGVQISSPLTEQTRHSDRCRFRCLTQGSAASLGDWLTVWQEIGLDGVLAAAALGIGHPVSPLSISHCEMDIGLGRSIYQVRLFSALSALSSSTTSSTYVASGLFYESSAESSYVYTPHTRKQRQSIDAVNWLLGDRLASVRANCSTLPFALINSLMTTTSSQGRLSDLFAESNEGTEIHVMGLALSVPTDRCEARKPSTRSSSPKHVWDVTHASVFNSIPHKQLLRHRMPGVSPHSWIVEAGEELCGTTPASVVNTAGAETVSKNSSTNHQAQALAAGRTLPGAGDHSSLYVVRHCSSSEFIFNSWLQAVASQVALPKHSGPFRSAKWLSTSNNQSRIILAAPASGFAESVRSGISDEAESLSTFRLPVGSLLTAQLKVRGITAGALISEIESIRLLAVGLRRAVCNPVRDLRSITQWMIFDYLTGMHAQMPHRYQVTHADRGLDVTPLPFWTLQETEQVQNAVLHDFGFGVVHEPRPALEVMSHIDHVIEAFGFEAQAFFRFRNTCKSRIRITGQKLLEQIESSDPRLGFISTAHVEQFSDSELRIAKLAVEHALDIVCS